MSLPTPFICLLGSQFPFLTFASGKASVCLEDSTDIEGLAIVLWLRTGSTVFSAVFKALDQKKNFSDLICVL